MEKWIYDEFKHCGVDYANSDEAENYDNRHETFRDFEKEFASMLDFLELENTKEMSLIDLGCGTGATSIYASNKFKKVFAVDVSEVMLAQLQEKVVSQKIQNIDIYHAGFLTYSHPGQASDLIVTKHSFHHLPDFWKQIALFRINKMLKNDGILYICDVTYHFDPSEYKSKIGDWVKEFDRIAGKKMSAEVETHIREEFSTFHWILEEMLNKAGFTIEKFRVNDGFVTEYFCRKIKEVDNG